MPQWLLSAIFAVEFLGESIIWKEMKLKFVLAMVTALPLAFMACKKEQGPNPGKDATVRIAVLLPDGTPVPGAEVRVYDEAGGKALEKNPFAAPLETLTAGADGVVQYTMRVDRWFSGAKQRYVTFAVLQGTGDNYHLWSVGRTVEVGRSQRAEIRLEGLDEKPGVPSDPGPVSLRVSRQPDKLVYCLGEPLDLTGLEVMGRYEDDKEQAVEVTPAQVKGFSSERPAGELELTIEVGDRQTSFTVTVLPVRVENGVLTEVWPEADEIVLPEIVREIPEKAFAARRIKSIKLNEGLRTIGEMAFCGASVPEIILPASLEQLGDHAFYHCAGLTRVDMSRTQLAACQKTSLPMRTSSRSSGPPGWPKSERRPFWVPDGSSGWRFPRRSARSVSRLFARAPSNRSYCPTGLRRLLAVPSTFARHWSKFRFMVRRAIRPTVLFGGPVSWDVLRLSDLPFRGASGLWSRDCCPAIPGYRRSSFRQASGRLLSGRSTTRESVRSAWRPRHRPLPG